MLYVNLILPFILAGIEIYSHKKFRHPLSGKPLPASDIYIEDVDPGYPNKKIRKLITPRVLHLAREQFGCPSLKGVPIEDDEMVV